MKQKRLLLLALVLIIPLISMVSALPTLTQFFNAVGESELALILVGTIIFVICNFAIGRALGPDGKMAAGIISACLAIGGSYLTLRYGYTQQIGDFIFGFAYNLGLPADITYPVIFFIALGIFIFLAVVTTFSWALAIFGVLMILISSYTYESDLTVFIGIVLIIAAFVVGWIRHHFRNSMYISGGAGWLRGRAMRPGIFGLLSRAKKP